MKSLQTIQKLSKLGRVLSKIAFVFAFIAFCSCIAGIIGMQFGSEGIIKFGGITLHVLIPKEYGYSAESITAVLFGWLFVFAGEAVIAKFAEYYFKNELNSGTPFTLEGAKELLRLGILKITVPIGCAAVGSIAREIVIGFADAPRDIASDMLSGNASAVWLGIMLILGSLLCRYGAELKQSPEYGSH